MMGKFGNVGDWEYVKGAIMSYIPSGCFNKGEEVPHRIGVEKHGIFKISMGVTYGIRPNPADYMTIAWKYKTASSPEEVIKKIDELYDYLVKETMKHGLKPGRVVTPKPSQK